MPKTTEKRTRDTPKNTKKPKSTALTPAQLAARERVTLPDGRWYTIAFDEDGAPITDPARLEIWEMGDDGREVTWVSQAHLAKLLGCTPRWLQKLDGKGLPARGYRDTCEYPIPHAIVWWLQYQRRLKDGQVRYLGIEEAMAQHERENAIENADIEYRMKTDPLYRDWMLAEEAGDFPRAEKLLQKLWARDGRPGERRR